MYRTILKTTKFVCNCLILLLLLAVTLCACGTPEKYHVVQEGDVPQDVIEQGYPSENSNQRMNPAKTWEENKQRIEKSGFKDCAAFIGKKVSSVSKLDNENPSVAYTETVVEVTRVVPGLSEN